MTIKKKTFDILDTINLALQPSDENFSILLSYFFVWFKPIWLKSAIREWISPREVLERYISGTYGVITKKILDLWWEPWLNDFLSDANKVYNYVSRDPEIKKLLDTPEGRKYFNYAVREIYDWAYSIVSK